MRKPKIILLVDYPNWAFDHIARSITKRLNHKFDFSIKYFALNDKLDASQADLVHVFCWSCDYYKKFGFKKEQIIKEVASMRWKHEDNYGPLTAEEFSSKYLDDCSCVVTPAISILQILEKHTPNALHLPNGVESEFFLPPTQNRSSDKLTIGWVGNPKDLTKGLFDILIPAAANYNFLSSNGQMSRHQLSNFYKEIDVLAIASIAEGQPLPLLESMSAGCFPVVTNVGIVPEIIVNRYNGLIVNRSIDSFRTAFDWCEQNLQLTRDIGAKNRVFANARSWDQCIARVEEIYYHAYEKKIGVMGKKIDVIFQFPSQEIESTFDAYGRKLWIWPGLYNFYEIFRSRWSRFWLGDPFAPGFFIAFKFKIIEFIKIIRKLQ